MDTILFFYKKRDLKEPEAEPIGLKSYLLVRVGLNVGEDAWFGEQLGMTQNRESGAQEEPLPQNEKDGSGVLRRVDKLFGMLFKRQAGKIGRTGEEPESGVKKRRFSKKQRRGEQLRQQKEAQQREAFLAQREARIQRTQNAIRRLTAEILEYAGAESSFFCVYEESVRKVLKGQKSGDSTKRLEDREQEAVLPALWQQSFAWKEFTDYSSRFWTGQLLPRAELPHFVILGYAACIPEILGDCMARMKSLRWILAEADDTEGLQAFVEDFYVESGLAISLQTIPDAGEFRRLRLTCALPANILDFTGEPRILDLSGVAEGSIWLDLQSMEEKKKWIQGRGRGIVYISMKEIWKYAQRRCNAPVLP